MEENNKLYSKGRGGVTESTARKASDVNDDRCAKRQRYSTADVVGAYLLTDMKDCVLVKLTGTTVDLMCQVKESYKFFISYEHGKKLLYIRLSTSKIYRSS